MKKTTAKKILAVCLCLCIVPGEVSAGVPAVETDEAAYVNLDYYGGVKDISIVKGAMLNGNHEIVDYGIYDTVINMTNYVKPEVREDGVSFTLDDTTDRFYYQVTPKKDTVILPWRFDISYRLNGVPKKAEELAGASGLVEIEIQATANNEAREYDKNNMILQAATMVNMEDAYSIEAPGSQLQSIGTYKAVIFAALPGESKTFTIRIGTDRFTFQGVTMAMIPGTLDQLQDIKDLKESKDKIKDAADDIYDSMDSLLTTMQTMTEGISQAQKGLQELDAARAGIADAKGQLHTYAGEALGKLGEVTQDIYGLAAQIQSGKDFVSEMQGHVNEAVDTLEETKEQLAKTKDSLNHLLTDLKALRAALADAQDMAKDRQALFESLSESMKAFGKSTEGLENNSKSLGENLTELTRSSSNLKGVSNDMLQIGNILGSLDPSVGGVLGAISGPVANINSATHSVLSDVGGFTSSMGATATSLKSMTESGAELMQKLSELTALGNDYAKLLEDNYESNDDTLAQISNMLDTATEAADTAASLIDQLTSANDTLSTYEPELITFLDKTESLTLSLSDGLVATLTFLNALEREIRLNGDTLNGGTKKTLAGLTEVLDKSLDGIADTDILKNANSTVKDTIDQELNHFEEDTNVLNMDYELPIPSFTSEKNPEPESIQVILRSEEIEVEEAEDINRELEPTEQKTGVWERIKNIFKSLWRKVSGVFQKKG